MEEELGGITFDEYDRRAVQAVQDVFEVMEDKVGSACMQR